MNLPFTKQARNTSQNILQKNAAFDVQKAFAIQVFTTAISTWGQGILEACKTASDVTGFSNESIRRWASSYFMFIESFPAPCDIDRDSIEQELSSNRGTGSGNQSSIIHDEHFRQKAREFVRANAYKKGEPNLTAHGFKFWIDNTYGVNVCDDMLGCGSICWDFPRSAIRKVCFSMGTIVKMSRIGQNFWTSYSSMTTSL